MLEAYYLCIAIMMHGIEVKEVDPDTYLALQDASSFRCNEMADSAQENGWTEESVIKVLETARKNQLKK